MGAYVDVLKFAGGSFALMPESAVRGLIDTCHSHDVLVSTGGFIEHVLTMGPEAVDGYLEECKRLGFDIVEVSSGFISVPDDDLVRLVEKVRNLDMLPKPEVGIQFGAGGASSAAELEAEGVSDPSRAIRQAKRYLEAGKPCPQRCPPCGTSRSTRRPGAPYDAVSWCGRPASRRSPDAFRGIGVVRVPGELGGDLPARSGALKIRVLDSLGCAYGAIATAAGAAKALRLDPPRIANAVAIAGAANNASIIALVNPASEFTLPVPKLKRASMAWVRVYR